MTVKFNSIRFWKAARRCGLYTYVDVAKALGITHQSVRAWFIGIADPTLKNACRLSEILNVSVEYLEGKGADTDLPDDRAVKEREPDDAILSLRVFDYYDRARVQYGIGADQFLPVSLRLLGKPVMPGDATRAPFAVTVTDSSMKSAGLSKGIIAIVNPCCELFDGDTVLAVVNSRPLLRWVFFDKKTGGGTLTPASKAFDSVTFTQEDTEKERVLIVGKVVCFFGTPAVGR